MTNQSLQEQILDRLVYIASNRTFDDFLNEEDYEKFLRHNFGSVIQDYLKARIESVVPERREKKHDLGEYTLEELGKLSEDALIAMTYLEGRDDTINEIEANIKSLIGKSK